VSPVRPLLELAGPQDAPPTGRRLRVLRTLEARGLVEIDASGRPRLTALGQGAAEVLASGAHLGVAAPRW
jgi:hypothetical protein